MSTDLTAVAAANAATISRREAMFASLTSRVLDSGSVVATTPTTGAAQQQQQQSGGNIILYDGVCLVCNAFINFVTDHDPEGKMHFAPLQSGQPERISQRAMDRRSDESTRALLYGRWQRCTQEPRTDVVLLSTLCLFLPLQISASTSFVRSRFRRWTRCS